MSQIFHLPEEILQEFTIDNDGIAYASQSAIARLCGITRQSINELFDKILSGKSLSDSLQPFSGNDYSVSGKIPDIVVAAIINHYAMYARNTTEQAKKVSLAFQAIGIRSWIQDELGWKKTQESISSRLADDLMLADFAAKAAQNAGVDKDITEQIKLDSLMKLYPERQGLLSAQKNAIAASKPLPELPMTPTEVGQKLGVIFGVEKVSAKKVNSRLLELGYQGSVTRIKKSNGKEVHDYYQPTDKGEKHSQLQMTAYTQGEGKSTKAQLRWFSSIVQILANNWEEN